MSLTGLLLGVLAFAGGIASVRAQRFHEYILDPQTHRSPSGEFVLEVDPSTRLGTGKGVHRLMRAGKEVWSASLAFTLWDAEVADDGSVAGYAHTTGMEGYALYGGDGELRLVILDPLGKPRLDRAWSRDEGSPMHGFPHPVGNGVWLDSEGDRVVFRVLHLQESGPEEEWACFELSTGESTASLRPKELLSDVEPLLRLLVVRPVPATPLTLCQWYTLTSGRGITRSSVGTRFVLVDAAGRPVWALDLPRDYSSNPDERAADRLRSRVHSSGAVLDTTETGRFELALVAEAKRVTFEVRMDAAAPSGWKVTELGRADYVFPIEDEPAELAPLGKPLSTELLGTIELQGAAVQEPEHIVGFDIDDRGRIGLVKSAADAYRFELMESDGQLLHETALDLAAGEEPGPPGAIWIEGQRWLVHRSGFGEDATALAWWLDLPDGGLAPIEGFESAPIDKADGTLDGGFVVLASSHEKYTIVQTLAAYDAHGKERWSHFTAYGQSEIGLLSPEDVRVSPEGEIGVLDNIKKEIQRFDLDGNPVGNIDLEEILGREPNYPTELGVDPEGNWIVYDFNGAPPVLRISREGQFQSELEPHFADGRVIEPHVAVLAAPDGRLWTTDGFAMLQLDESGTVDRVLGAEPDVQSLGEIQFALVDHLARILVVDSRTLAVHAFDREGRKISVFTPEPNLATGRVEEMTVAGDGSIYLGGVLGDRYRRVAFSPTGAWLGEQDLRGESHFKPGKQERWRISYHDVELLDAQGTLQRRIERKADRTWFGMIRTTAVAPDGSLAVIDDRDGAYTLSVVSPDGEVVLTTTCPGQVPLHRAAFGEGRVFFWSGDMLWCFELATRTFRSRKLELGLEREYASQPFWEARSKELWLLDADARRVLRYRVGD